MINAILDAITNALYAEFGDDYEIYTGKIEQGLKEPCFFVRCINPTNELFLGKRRKTTNQFAIHYFPSEEVDIYTECNDMFERLIECLEYIYDGFDAVRGEGFEYNISDGVLIVTVNYEFFVIRKGDEEEKMEEMTYEGGVNNGE